MNHARELQRFYIILLIPALAANGIFYAFTPYIPLGSIGKVISYKTAGTIVLVLSALFSVALPLLFRSFFANTVQGEISVSTEKFVRFQKKLLSIGMTAPYISAAAMVLRLSGLYLYGPVLLALYGLYFYFPSSKRIHHDKKIFRVGNDTTNMV